MNKQELDKLKKEHGVLKAITVQNKKMIVRQPSIAEFAIMRAMSEKGNSIEAIHSLANVIVLTERELLKDDSVFLNIAPLIIDSIDIINGEIEEKEGKYIYTTDDGKTATFKQMSRKELGEYQLMSNSGREVRGAENLGNALFLEGDRDIIEKEKYFFGVFELFPLMLKPIEASLEKL